MTIIACSFQQGNHSLVFALMERHIGVIQRAMNINENQLCQVIATGLTLIIPSLFGLVLTFVLAL